MTPVPEACCAPIDDRTTALGSRARRAASASAVPISSVRRIGIAAHRRRVEQERSRRALQCVGHRVGIVRCSRRPLPRRGLATVAPCSAATQDDAHGLAAFDEGARRLAAGPSVCSEHHMHDCHSAKSLDGGAGRHGLPCVQCMTYIVGMREVDLRRIDLNLLVVLEALLDERNVTRAAHRLGMSQPAASRALGRLRALFSDALLVDGPGGYVAQRPCRRDAPGAAQDTGRHRRDAGSEARSIPRRRRVEFGC